MNVAGSADGCRSCIAASCSKTRWKPGASGARRPSTARAAWVCLPSLIGRPSVGAAKLEKWEVIRRDLGPFRGRVLNEPSLWGRLLLAAIDLLAWSKEEFARQTLTACRKEVEHVAEQFQPLAAELNQRNHLFDWSGPATTWSP